MAFAGRGSGGKNSGSRRVRRNRIHVGRYYGTSYQYGPAFWIIAVIMFFTCLIGILYSYKPSIIDPISGIKKLYVNGYLISLGILLIFILIVHKKSKDSKELSHNLFIALLASFALVLTFISFKIFLDKIYTETKFEEIYLNVGELQTDINLIDTNRLATKSHYVSECKNLYAIFDANVFSIFILHFTFNLLLIYITLKAKNNRDKIEKVQLHDDALFDEEINIKC